MNAAEHIVSFETPAPARLDIDLEFGAVWLSASGGTTTTVTVRPAVADRRQDRDLADAARIDHAGGVVSVRAHHGGRLSSLFRPGGVEVAVEAPVGTYASLDIGYANLVAEGRWGHLRIRSSYGDVRLHEADRLDISTSGGSVAVGITHAGATISNSYGPILVGDAAGPCALRNSSGDIAVVTARGDLELRSSYGQVMVDRAVSGSVRAVTSYGSIDLGIAPGTAVRVDAQSKSGNLSNRLSPTNNPAAASERLEVHARSGWGDIVIRRAGHQGAPS